MKINIIMPTFNDSDTIVEALNSLNEQIYRNWHLTVVNDGSTDCTELIIKDYIKSKSLENKVTYIYQENNDQLNAIKRALETIENDSIIFILHSDDLFYNNEVLKKVNDYYQKENPDALISDYDIIDKNGNYIKTVNVRKYKKSNSLIALQGLWLGRNLFVDFAFCKAKVYKQNIANNYLTWNTPFWLNHNMTLLNVHNSNFKTYKYRIFEGNYINDEIGLLNVLNGELRTEINILKHFKIPFYKVQYFIFRLLNKIKINYKVVYQNKETKNIYPIIKFLINKRIDIKDISKYPYYEAIINFYKNNNNRTITINKVKKEDLFYGSDVRKFNNLMVNNKLPNIYYNIFKEMEYGFKKIITPKDNYENLLVLLKFLDIDENVEIELN